MTKLLVVTPLYPPEGGGPATYSKALEDGLGEKGIVVTVIAFHSVRKYPKVLRHAIFAWKVYGLARTNDLILALDPVSVGFPTMCASFFARKPYVVKVVGDYAWEQGRQRHGVVLPLDEFVKTKKIPLQSRVLRYIEYLVTRRARHILVPSEYLKGIVKTWGLPDRKVTVVHNSVPIDEELLESLKYSQGVTVVTNASRLVPWKGIRGLITAFAQIVKNIPDAKLIIIGGGPDEGELKEYAKSTLPLESFQFTGTVEHRRALSITRSADVFVLNSTYEGLSHVLIEALSLGRAVIATKAGGNTELVVDGENGYLISVGDTKALTEKLLYLLTNEKERDRLGKNALRAREDFSRPRMLTRTAELLKNLP